MVQPFVGEIRMFGGNFAPTGFAQCDGQLIQISQNNALFALLGTVYGGDGRTTFGLPDLRGRVPIHYGQGPGLSNRPIGQTSGSESVALTGAELPAHTHGLQASSDPADDVQPGGRTLGVAPADVYVDSGPDVAMATDAISAAGGGQAHTNLMPYQVINYVIALVGIFPSRT